MVFREEFVRDHEDAVQEFVKHIIEAGMLIRNDVDKAAQIAVSFLDPKKELGLKKNLPQKCAFGPQRYPDRRFVSGH